MIREIKPIWKVGRVFEHKCSSCGVVGDVMTVLDIHGIVKPYCKVCGDSVHKTRLLHIKKYPGRYK